MGASLRVDASGFTRLAAAFNSPALKATILQIPQRKAVAAIVAQAIADNFEQEGPGWAPLKAATIRYSVAKKLQRLIRGKSDAQLARHEAAARHAQSSVQPFRRLLRRTDLLYKTVTTPGFSGSNKSGANGRNIWKTEGTHLIWGTDLVYAGVHQNGDSKKGIPARPYLTIRKQWLLQIQEYILTQAINAVKVGIKAATGR